MIRGITGRLLKHNVCHDFRLSCNECEFINTCVYPALFESPDKLVNKLGRGGTVPHPYIIRCHDERTAINEGEDLAFEVLLFGTNSEIFATYLLHVFEKFESYKFGKDHVSFTVTKVKQKYRTDRRIIMDDASISKPEIEQFTYQVPSSNKILIQFITPCRILKKGKAEKSITLREFLWQINHRIQQLEVLNNMKEEYKTSELVFPKEETMKVLNIEWDEIIRYSLRQEQYVKLGGIKTTFELNNTEELQPWLPSILFAEKFHIGKATTFGLGQFQVWFK